MCSLNGDTFLKALTRDKFNPHPFVSQDYSHLSWSWQPCEDKNSRGDSIYPCQPILNWTGEVEACTALTVHHKSHVRSCIPCIAHISWLAACYITTVYLMNTWDGRDPHIFLSTFLVSCLHAISQWGIWTCLMKWLPEAARNHSSFLLK